MLTGSKIITRTFSGRAIGGHAFARKKNSKLNINFGKEREHCKKPCFCCLQKSIFKKKHGLRVSQSIPLLLLLIISVVIKP